MSYLIMRNDLTGLVVTKDVGPAEKLKRTYCQIFGHQYTFFYGDFTEPYTDIDYLRTVRSQYKLLSCSERVGGKMVWRLHDTRSPLVHLGLAKSEEQSADVVAALALSARSEAELYSALKELGTDHSLVKWCTFKVRRLAGQVTPDEIMQKILGGYMQRILAE